jgi:hypothetical protein
MLLYWGDASQMDTISELSKLTRPLPEADDHGVISIAIKLLSTNSGCLIKVDGSSALTELWTRRALDSRFT